jgi:hypothetical protein
MTKPNLRQALSQRPAQPPPPAAKTTEPRRQTVRPDRAGKKFVGGWFDKQIR